MKKTTSKPEVKLNKVKYDEKGYTCSCGKIHKYPAYVYAHWYEELTHTCNCGRSVKIQNGVAH